MVINSEIVKSHLTARGYEIDRHYDLICSKQIRQGNLIVNITIKETDHSAGFHSGLRYNVEFNTSTQLDMSCPQRKLNIELIGFTPEDLIAKLPNIEENIVFDMQRAINGLKI